MSLRKEQDNTSEIQKNFDVESTPLLKIVPHAPPKLERRFADAAEILAKARRLLYLSHAFNQFSDIAWQFCLVLFLAAFSNYKSLMLVSTYGLLSGLSVFLFGSTAGRFIDHANRLMVAQRFIWAENICVLLATICCYILLARDHDLEDTTDTIDNNGSKWQGFQGLPTDFGSIVLLIGIHLLGATAKIFDLGFLVAVERDWVVVMSRFLMDDGLPHERQLEIQKKWLSETNVTMKQIDLSCKVAAPAIAGFCIALLDDGKDPHHGSDLRGAAVFIGALNALALLVEYICTAKIYNQIPDLAIKSKRGPAKAPELEPMSSRDEAKENVAKKTSHPRFLYRMPDGLRVYLDQSISWAGISLALLYLNVLTFGGIMTAYLVWRGMRLETIGLWRGVSAAAGLAGTFVYHISSKHLSLVASGMWSVVFQLICLSMSYASLFVEDNDISLAMLIAGVCASRVGLWVFDISVTQLMQDYIPADVRGLVGGVQQSLNALFGLLSFALGIFLPDPKDFYIYVAAGYASVGLAVICFTFGVYFRRDKLGPHAIDT